MEVAAVIPARYGSTRLPAKVLADLGGKPVIRRIWENCVAAGVFSRVIVAADHPAVLAACRSFGADAVMTDPAHGSGTERVAEVAQCLAEPVVVNVQGDEPFIDAAVLAPVVARAREGDADVVTPVTPITSGGELADPSVVKAVLGEAGRALYFSRWPVPFLRDAWSADPCGAARGMPQIPPGLWWKHLGIYAFRREVLLRLVKLPRHPLEETEKLEQLRWLAHGAAIVAVAVENRGVSIDTADDLERARGMLHGRDE
jgi:3-deoxy-manno-octulosonate cytidylyltransferase (CMP-KDO synthetase)